ncbi:hypothetical protein VMCG_09417 [Cytospora schulzeri]|uniref:SprT-like domain-containing protein n=1 Tax=Cytospora schulzeri TaxID=448051 RepID=A0A423VIB6_9PEZI|nr:hypothetical protein VMCG_09417 [Valsa malicola]
MVRQARTRRIVDDSSDDEFPDIRQIGSFQTKSSSSSSRVARPPPPPPPPARQAEESPSKGTVRRRRLGPISDNAVHRPSMARETSGTIFDDDDDFGRRKLTKPRRTDFQPRRMMPIAKSLVIEDLSEADSVHEETIIEDFSCDDDESDFIVPDQSSNSEREDPTAGLYTERSPSRSLKRLGGESRARKVSGANTRSPSPSSQLLAEASRARERGYMQESGSSRGIKSKSTSTSRNAEGSRSRTPTDLYGSFTKLKAYELQPPRSRTSSSYTKRPTTPTSPPPEPRYKGLASPSKKINRIPTTPHHPQTDTFWSQEFIDEWNDEHSPKKQLFPPSARQPPQSPPKKGRSSSSPAKKAPSQTAVARAAKKAFEQSKHELADAFLRELDERVTDGRISELAAGTGGIRVEWTNRLNTTAGRANWRREKTTTTSRRKDGHGGDGGGDGATSVVTYRHHASVELAEKVIDDEDRLLNVIAHEFCHLANFMVSGVTNNPHGREFKTWAAKVTAAFGRERGIEVTTKHSYDIDFKYVWECAACGLEFKRHSRSINTERHRCGACKGELRQTRPVPRARPAGGESEYQRFMKEQMKVIRLENPGCPQRDIMKLVAGRWSQKEREKGEEKGDYSGDRSLGSDITSLSSSRILGGGKEKVEGVTKSVRRLTLENLTDLIDLT